MLLEKLECTKASLIVWVCLVLTGLAGLLLRFTEPYWSLLSLLGPFMWFILICTLVDLKILLQGMFLQSTYFLWPHCEYLAHCTLSLHNTAISNQTNCPHRHRRSEPRTPGPLLPLVEAAGPGSLPIG